ncbi:STAS-like domain-containing protein [Nocardioides currus]|uniref:DUF4325 domain-containing protein n=1 Tax=Nocardioides currus TaxID=2133958 RepID=A0A2R7Z0Q4_9ACTN|nr:STAS-like domain-containing protein [Nocardioides currus]PUA82192.1 hypothetical protein C7S10_00020 [Nocardioides currus]
MTKVKRYAGSFAGDKDAAATLREEVLKPGLAKHRVVLLDFDGVELATQSFMHALLAQAVREDPASLEHIEFKNCNDDIQALIEIVVDYAQEDFAVEED